MTTLTRSFKSHWYVIGLILILAIVLPGADARGQQNSVPDGFSLLAARPGVEIYKGSAGGSSRYIQIVNLGQGASIKLPYGSIVDPGTDTGPYGGDNPSIRRQPLQTFWDNFASSDSKSFCITNGEFFADQANGQIIDPTSLAFSLKVDGVIVSDGYAVLGAKEEYVDQKLMLEIWSDRVDIIPLTKENLLSSSAPNIIAGLTQDANKDKFNTIGRTFIGIQDTNSDGQFEILQIFNSASSTQLNAANTLASFGASKVMMLDGGGSTQLICEGQSLISGSRTLPQALAVLSATHTDVPNPDDYSCSQPGYIGFEDFLEKTNLSSGTVSGVQFTTTNGYTWLVGDFSTGSYNGKYPTGGYTSNGTHWAWLGESQGSGIIKFPKGPASYFSLLVSNTSSVSLDAYNINHTLIATAGPAIDNYNTGYMSELRIVRADPDMAYVIVHDTGNYFLIDSVCTNAPGTPNTINQIVNESYFMETGQNVIGNFFINLVTGVKKYLHIVLGPYFSDVDFILIRPDGSIVSALDLGVEIIETPNKIEVSIEDAIPGEWSYQILANQLEIGGENIQLSVYEESIILVNQPTTIFLPVITR